MVVDKKNSIEVLAKNKILFHVNNDVEYYLCSCGKLNSFHNHVDKNEVEPIILSVKDLVGDKYSDDNDEYRELLKMSYVLENDKACSECRKDFKNEAFYNRIISSGDFLTTLFKSEDLSNGIMLSVSNVTASFSNFLEKFETIETKKSIHISKLTKKITFINGFSEPQEIGLDEIYKYVSNFFDINTKRVDGIMDLHIFASKLSGFVTDANSINIFNGLISELSNKAIGVNNQDVFKKIITTFLCIIAYSNLSTVAMTKGTVFLYDMIAECELPKPEVLIENKVTSPLKIFNFLVKNYIKKISGELNSDNKNVVEFNYMSKKFKSFSLNNKYEAKHVNEKGEISVDNINGDGQISKLIFKKIKNFSDYKNLIGFLKFISYGELLQLVQSYDVEFLVEFIKLIYFRKTTDFNKINKLIPIVISYCKQKEYEVISNYDESYINYSTVKNFSFIEYDDSIKMLLMLQATTPVEDLRGQEVIAKAIKEFYKINTYDKLIDFHDELNVYYKGVADPQKNSKFREFASQFRYLEEKDEEYNGPLDIEIIATPDGVIKEGWEMQHSAPAYIDGVVENRYLMCRVFDRSENVDKDEIVRFTLGLDYNKNVGLTFDQVKGFGNKLGSNRFKKLMIKYLEAKDISYQPIKDLKIELE